MNNNYAKVLILNMEIIKMEATRMLDQRQDDLDKKAKMIDKKEKELNNMVQRIVELDITPPEYIKEEIERTRKEISESREDIKRIQGEINKYRDINPTMWNGFPE